MENFKEKEEELLIFMIILLARISPQPLQFWNAQKSLSDIKYYTSACIVFQENTGAYESICVGGTFKKYLYPS